MKYCIDTSALIDAWYEYFPPDLFEPVWNTLSEMCEREDIVSVEMVMDELRAQDDDLQKWAGQFESLSYPLDAELQQTVRHVMDSCSTDPRTGLVIPTSPKSGADPFVIALALNKGIPVVSQENARTDQNQRLKLPDACRLMGVRHMNLLEMARAEGWKFDLRST